MPQPQHAIVGARYAKIGTMHRAPVTAYQTPTLARIHNASHPASPHRRTLRLQGYDYSQSGGYFLTMVTHERKCIFGEMSDGNLRLTRLGEIARECWTQIPAHFPRASVEEFVVMPNHIHGILFLHDDPEGTMYRAPTAAAEQFGQPAVGSTPTILRSYKAAVSHLAGRELNLTNIWQRNYYEHILREQADYERAAG